MWDMNQNFPIEVSPPHLWCVNSPGRFIYGDDKFRNERLKLIPRVMEGAWVVQRAVGTVPVLLGKAVKVRFSHSLHSDTVVNTTAQRL